MSRVWLGIPSLFLAACSLTDRTLETPADKPTPTSSPSAISASAVVANVRSWLDSPPPIALEFLIDPSAESPGADHALIRSDVLTIADVLAERSGSLVRYWVLGDDASTTLPIATVTVSAPGQVGHSMREAFVTRERERIITTYDKLQVKVPHRSPIFSSVVRITQETIPPNTQHVVVLASDLLEYSELGNLECNDPNPASWQTSLSTAHLFLPQSLQGVTIVAIHAGLHPSRSCLPSIAHHDAVIALWQGIMARAGARFLVNTGSLTPEAFRNQVLEVH